MEAKILQLPHGYNKGAELDLCPSITTSCFESNNLLKEPVIAAMRGRNPKSPSKGKHTEQRLEINDSGVSNALTTVQKDNLVVNYEPAIPVQLVHRYPAQLIPRIRKLTPKECWRLMGASDEDYNKAKAAGVSKTQLYKQAGNGIVKHVLMAIFGQLYGVDWKPLVYGKYYKTEQERMEELPLFGGVKEK